MPDATAVLVALPQQPAASAEVAVPSNPERVAEEGLQASAACLFMIPTVALVVACALKYASLELFSAPAAEDDECADASATQNGEMTAMPLRPMDSHISKDQVRTPSGC